MLWVYLIKNIKVKSSTSSSVYQEGLQDIGEWMNECMDECMNEWMCVPVPITTHNIWCPDQFIYTRGKVDSGTAGRPLVSWAPWELGDSLDKNDNQLMIRDWSDVVLPQHSSMLTGWFTSLEPEGASVTVAVIRHVFMLLEMKLRWECADI